MVKDKWGRRRDCHLTMIGMPTAGKTKIGKLVAQYVGRTFVDIDDCIVEKIDAPCLQDVVDQLSEAEFAQLEEDVAIQTLLRLPKPSIIATGGSMVYHKKAMEIFAQMTCIVHLNASFETIQERVRKHPNRGIVFAPGETLEDLYARRMPLYAKWAHHTVDVDHSRSAVAQQLAKDLSAWGFALHTPDPRHSIHVRRGLFFIRMICPK